MQHESDPSWLHVHLSLARVLLDLGFRQSGVAPGQDLPAIAVVREPKLVGALLSAACSAFTAPASRPCAATSVERVDRPLRMALLEALMSFSGSTHGQPGAAENAQCLWCRAHGSKALLLYPLLLHAENAGDVRIVVCIVIHDFQDARGTRIGKGPSRFRTDDPCVGRQRSIQRFGEDVAE